ncbi:uracil-DNA glycosylase [[Mycobacterium] zoologicum]|uniref:uracil-DNA glycosylase n=1 Tax=[Mycobacterium] zoologicum TaxID=2872311 RepID=UPI001CDAD9DA|nr:uracil-DNA glycosylase family protein [Mycolicibacter sp. MYC101]MEB3063672.1 uracil-DNA glycosylase family protein [Mycolicibacter sp. MYC101]
MNAPSVDDRRRHMAVLAAAIKVCRLCPGLNIAGETESAPGYGAVDSPVALVGQSLCGKLCMDSQIPFTGGSGQLLDQSFERARIEKRDVFITNVVHCHPPQNRESLDTWVSNCSPYLNLELKIVRPRLVIGLGQDAKHALERLYDRQAQKLERPCQSLDLDVIDNAGPKLLFTEHPSWIKRQHSDQLESDYVASLAAAFTMAFRAVT